MARSTMAKLIQDVRALADVGEADYTVGGLNYWSDDQIQGLLDLHRREIRYEVMTSVPTNTAGVVTYTEYWTGLACWETSPTIQDGSYTVQGTATYTFDANQGVCTFSTDTTGATRIISGTVYNLNAVAAEIWTRKAAHYALSYDVSTDNHALSRSQMAKAAQGMARTFQLLPPSWNRGRGGGGSGSIYAERGDMDGGE